VAVSALVVSAGYLVWRAVFTIEPSAWFVAIPMFLMEAHHALGLGLYTFSLWDVDAPPAPAPVSATSLRVAMLIPTYDESVDVLLPVISAALAIDPAHETWVLDDGNRLAVAELARGLGARYLSRAENTDFKAGNLNNALRHIDADLVGVIDADHVVEPGFFTNTLGYFEDPGIAAVQTPQDFYNLDSFEHEPRDIDEPMFNEQAVFYRVILPAKNRWNAVFWCGTSAVLRVAALRDVGGVATGSVTEDIHTSIRLHKKGWRIVAHNEVLARGLAASDANQYMLQRRRWARGAMQVMRSERLLTSPDLTIRQRLAYSATLIAWFDSLRSLGFIALPILVLATGVMPIDARIWFFGPAFLATFLAQFAAIRLLARGHYPPVLSVIFETLRMPAVVPALAELIRPVKQRFRVTPKGRQAETRTRVRPPWLLHALLGLSVIALIWFGTVVTGHGPVRYAFPEAMIGTAAFLILNVLLLRAALRRITDARYGGERRASVRFPVNMAATLGKSFATLTDLSLTGARLRMITTEAFDRGEELPLMIVYGRIQLEARVINVYRGADGVAEIGIRFEPRQWQAMRQLALLLFHGNPGHEAVAALAAPRPAVVSSA